MAPRQLHRAFGTIARDRGRASEQRVLDACVLAGRPPWMRTARQATPAEDHDGIDVVIESDVGKLYVQVKSSRRGKAAFEKRRRRVRAVVVVVAGGDTPDKLLRKVVGQLAALRAQFLSERSDGG